MEEVCSGLFFFASSSEDTCEQDVTKQPKVLTVTDLAVRIYYLLSV